MKDLIDSMQIRAVAVLQSFWGLTEEGFCLGGKVRFLFGGYIPAKWYEGQVNLMQCCRVFHKYCPQLSLKNLCNKHKHIELKLMKEMSNSDAILYILILWIFNILSTI